jgi:hypothetical protein
MGFSCYPPQRPSERKYDPKVGYTIMRIVANIFKAYPRAIITYICSSVDGQARHRSITFSKWYMESPLKEKIKHLKNNFDDTYLWNAIQ